MSQLRVLHIVPWFPHPANEIEGVFIAKHLLSLNKHCDNKVLHIRFSNEGKKEFDLTYQTLPLDRVTLKPFANRWRIKEWMAARTVKNYLDKNNNSFDVVNFYIAYPNAIAIEKMSKQFHKIQFMISEQWSAYHENFSLEKGNKGRERIEAIFKSMPPLIVVSDALGKDIQSFTGIDDLPYSIVPNSVDETVFTFEKKKKDDPFTFCSINNWSVMKNPLVLIKAFHILNQKHPNTQLVLAGSGPLDKAIEAQVNVLGLGQNVNQLGRVDKDTVVRLLHESHVYCQSSNYETFSAICIEALATGTPVIATNIGGMKDFVESTNGLLVDEMTAEAWSTAMEKVMLNYAQFDSEKIALNCVNRFNEKYVGELLFTTLAAIHDAK